MKRLICLGLVLAILCMPVLGAEDLSAAIIESCESGETLDLTGYGITTGELSHVFWALYESGRMPWYVDRQFEYQYQVDTDTAASFTPILLDKNSYDYILYEQTAAEILWATVSEGMEDWQIALSIHDYLIANFSYDETLSLHKGYDLLVGGSAVCDGYTEAYMDLMNRAGVPCVIVVSEEMGDVGHAWNLVKLGESWYHVDLTWDDPTPDSPGRVNYDFFLKTDREMLDAQTPHYGWETELACTDTTYSDIDFDQIQISLKGEGHSHNYTTWSSPANCLEPGRITYICQCGLSFPGETLEPTGHSYDSGTVVQKATLFKTGIRRITCRNCGDYYTEIIPRLTFFQWLGWK